MSKASKTRKWSDDVLDELIDMLGRKGLHLRDVFSSVEEIITNETEDKKRKQRFQRVPFQIVPLWRAVAFENAVFLVRMAKTILSENDDVATTTPPGCRPLNREYPR